MNLDQFNQVIYHHAYIKRKYENMKLPTMEAESVLGLANMLLIIATSLKEHSEDFLRKKEGR